MATSTTTQDSQLLKLPGELRNQIFELAIPSSTTILLRAQRHPPVKKTKGTVVRFHPKLPPLFKVCHQLRHESPWKRYYAENTFLFTDGMFAFSNIHAFFRSRGDAAQAMTRIKVVNYDVQVATVAKIVPEKRFRIRFDAIRTPDGKTTICDLQTTKHEYREITGRRALCCCALHTLAVDHSVRQAPLGDLLCAFDVEFKGYARSNSLVVCEECEGLKACKGNREWVTALKKNSSEHSHSYTEPRCCTVL